MLQADSLRIDCSSSLEHVTEPNSEGRATRPYLGRDLQSVRHPLVSPCCDRLSRRSFVAGLEMNMLGVLPHLLKLQTWTKGDVGTRVENMPEDHASLEATTSDPTISGKTDL